jgi:hypothetical protein
MTTERFSFSTFLREPKTVTAVLEQEDVLIERRDGSDFVMRSVEREKRERGAIQLLTLALSHVSLADVVQKLVGDDGVFAWARYLPDDDQDLFARDLLHAIQASADLGSYAGVELTVSQWRATAEVWSDPDLAERLGTPVDPPTVIDVIRPS